MIEIRGSRQTINQRYHNHAMNKVQQELVKRELEGDYDNKLMPGYPPPGAYGPYAGGYGFGPMQGGYGQGWGGYGMPGQMPGWMPSWMQDFFVGTEIGQGIYDFVQMLRGNKGNPPPAGPVPPQPPMRAAVSSQNTSTGNVSTQNRTQSQVSRTTSQNTTRTTDNDNTRNSSPTTADIDNAIKKEFGAGFKLPKEYTATLVGDTLVIKGKDGKPLDAQAIDKLKQTAATSGTDKAAEAQEKENPDETQTVINEADTDKNGTISYKEWTESVSSQLQADLGIEVTPEIKAKIEASAKELDSDGDGEITKEELDKNYSQVMGKLEEELMNDTVGDTKEAKFSAEEIMAFVDDDGDGKLSEKEWNEYREMVQDSGMKDPGEFKKFDKNGDGSITEDELNPEK